MKTIIRFFVKEHLFGNLLTILILAAGTYSLYKIRREIWPNVNFNITTVAAFMGGSSPVQVEKLIINPIEAALQEVDGIKKVNSTATESQGIVIIQLDPDARDSVKTNQDIQRAIDGIDEFPKDVDSPIVRSIDAAQSPVIEVTVGGQASEMEIRDIAKDIADELRLIKEVANVNKKGFRKKEYLVSADPLKLASRQVSLTGLINSISRQNVSIPSGSFETKSGEELLVRTEGQYTQPSEVLKTVLIANEAGYLTKISDVATVEESLADPERLYHSDGNPSINLVLSKKANADALKLVENIKNRVIQLRESISEKISIGFANDFSVYLTKRLNTLSSNLFVGLFLVIIILAIFLPWQVTSVVAVGIPVAMLATITVNYLIGHSLNMINLVGLIIVLGMLVDDAIVVTENIWRHMEKGYSVSEAAVLGASEVFPPVFASILTTISAFAPMLFMSGVFGSFVSEIPMMVILALFFSLIEAFIILPGHFASWAGPFISQKTIQKVSKSKKNYWFNYVISKYKSYVTWSLRYRYLIVLFVVLFMGGTFVVFKQYGRFVLFPPKGIELFFVSAEAPVGVSLKQMEKLIKPLEEGVLKIPKNEVKDFTTEIGIVQNDPNDPLTRRGSNYAQIRVNLTPQRDRLRTAQEIVEELKTIIVKPEGLERVNYNFAKTGPPQGRPISINFTGENFDTLKEIAVLITEKLGSYDGVTEIRDSFIPGKKEWQVLPRVKDLAEVGLSAADIAQSTRAAFEGIVASSIRTLDEEIDIRVKLNQNHDDLEKRLNNLKIGTPTGHLIRLGDIADFKPIDTISTVQHLDYKRVLNVSSEVDIEKITAMKVTADIKPFIDKLIKKYPGYGYKFGGEDEDTKESLQSLGVAFIFAALFIFFLLVVTFKNLSQPLLILTTIPLGIMGVVYTMLLHGQPLSFMALLGVVALSGVIVNNAIVFIDFVNRLRKEKYGIDRSIIEASAIRLRPIILTTITTVCGLLPTAYGGELQKIFGIGGSDPFIVPIALALGWGLAFGSFMTGLLFPSFVRVLDDIRGLPGRIMKKPQQAP